MGLSFLIAIMETIYVVKKQEVYRKMAQFWGHFLLLNFAVGVVTGILQEFQFGMNWSTFSRFVGDVFGVPLAIEGLLAFFLESTFIGLWVFGWDRLPKRLHLLCIWLVSIGTVLSAFWILSANAFMQHPVGFSIADGQAMLTDIAALLGNEQLWWEFPHVLFGSWATGAFLIAGISAWKLRRGQEKEVFQPSFRIGISVALVSSLLIAFFGHGQAQYLLETQPMKMAASEALWERSADPAPWKVMAVIDPEKRENRHELEIPYLLSLLSYDALKGSVPGMNDLQKQYEAKYGPGNYIPPVRTTFWSFRIMTGLGGLMIVLSLIGAIAAWRRSGLDNPPPLLMRLLTYAIGLPFLASTAGWIMTEIGRQPWTVFGLLRTADSVSPGTTRAQVLSSLISFNVMYALLLGLLAFLFIREARSGSHNHADLADEEPLDPYEWKGGRELAAE